MNDSEKDVIPPLNEPDNSLTTGSESYQHGDTNELLASQQDDVDSIDIDEEDDDTNTEPVVFNKFTKRKLVMVIASIFLHLIDLGSDVYVAILHFQNDNKVIAALTLVIILLPCVLAGIWVIIKCYKASMKFLEILKEVAPVLVPGGLAIRDIKDARKIWEAMHADNDDDDEDSRKEFLKKLKGNTDETVRHHLRECFMEDAPQLVLQLYTLLMHKSNTNRWKTAGQWITVLTSLLSLSKALVSEYESFRKTEQQPEINHAGLFCIFGWQFFTIAARVMSFAVFATFWKYSLLILVPIHFIAMLIWKRSFYTACVLNFCYYTLDLGNSRLGYAFYYTLVYLENIGMLLTWHYLHRPVYEWQWYLACVLIIGGLPLGLMFMTLYYVRFHPNNYVDNPKYPRIEMWKPYSELVFIKRKPSQDEIDFIRAKIEKYAENLDRNQIDKIEQKVLDVMSHFRGESLKRQVKYFIKDYVEQQREMEL